MRVIAADVDGHGYSTLPVLERFSYGISCLVEKSCLNWSMPVALCARAAGETLTALGGSSLPGLRVAR